MSRNRRTPTDLPTDLREWERMDFLLNNRFETITNSSTNRSTKDQRNSFYSGLAQKTKASPEAALAGTPYSVKSIVNERSTEF